ncbi:hypothetical protein D1114_21495 [Cereibacter sphaeroides]|uniref:Uncharacterized protein n=1 Tax=Cereibacter sphaeroides TaxID=1063 RepID=A0AAX1UF77_CERSP|nr:hypothetical protein [Cereibacter sphaeroides]RHZ91004.1 hypothetical protein D1114_21495 [Cereibacter sphaeroides]
MDLSLRMEDGGIGQALAQLGGPDLRRAVSWALNDTAQDVLGHVQERMGQVFDRPTPFTKNAFMVWRSTPQTLEAAVQERPSVGARHYLKVQERGGPRARTGFETLLDRRLSFAGDIRSVIPADNARLDAYGNWSRGERNQVLSALQAQGDARANSTAGSKKRNRRRASYFVPKAGLTPGVYKRTVGGQLGIVAVLSPKVPVYQQRLGFYEGAEDVARVKLPQHLGRTLGRAFGKRFGG